MKIAENPDRFAWFVRFATCVLIVFVLHAAQDVLLPIALSVLLAFLLSPLVVRLVRWKLPRPLAILTTVAIAFSAIGSIGWLVTNQALGLVTELPNYEENLRSKIAILKQPRAPSSVTRVTGMVQKLRQEMVGTPADPRNSPPDSPPESQELKPLPVEVHYVEKGPWDLAREMMLPVLRPLGVALLVTVFLIAMLFQREDLRDRFIRLVSAGKITLATQAVDDAATRVSRYLRMQLIVNTIYGVPIGLGLFVIGVPNAPLWGLLAGLLRFIPFVGTWIGALFPLALTVAVDPGWSMLCYAIAIFAVMELTVLYIVEPILYGASTGVSKLALLVAAVFWTWLWGPVGLVLSTPLTVCVLVLGSYVPALNFLRMILGDDSAAEPAAQLYQRMLSMESEDMLDVAAKFLAEHSLEEFYERMFVPALLLSEEDRHNGTLPEFRQRFIFQSSRYLIEELERRDETARLEAAADAPVAEQAVKLPLPPAVFGLPAGDEADELVGLALGHLLRRRGVPTAVLSLAAPLDETLATIERSRTRAIFISALPPSAVAVARQLCRRIRARFPDITILVGIWQHPAGVTELSERLRGVRPDHVAVNLADAVTLTAASMSTPSPFPSHGPKPDSIPAAEAIALGR